MTTAEKELWKLFRDGAFSGWKFRRQHPVGPYIADFCCVEQRLVVEVDGGQHCESSSDARRTVWLEQHGWRVLRFWNNEVLENIEGVYAGLVTSLSHEGEVSEGLAS